MRSLILLLLTAFILTGCGTKPPPAATRVRQVNVEWIGHNAFRIVSSLGITVVTDPFDPKLLTYPVPAKLTADALLVTHEHSAANSTDLLTNTPQIFRTTTGVGLNRASGIVFRGIPTYGEGTRPGEGLNVVYSWTMDGVNFCHLGTIRRPLTAAEIRQIGRVDVLFLPVGGPRELSDAGRQQILTSLQPRIVVPMGYATRYTDRMPLRGLNEWLGGKQNVRRLSGRSFRVEPDALPPTPVIYVPAIP